MSARALAMSGGTVPGPRAGTFAGSPGLSSTGTEQFGHIMSGENHSPVLQRREFWENILSEGLAAAEQGRVLEN